MFFLFWFSVMRYGKDGRSVGTSIKDNQLLSEGLDGYLGENTSPELCLHPGGYAHPEGSIKTCFVGFFPFAIVLVRGGFLNSAI